jgi:hypothetical protein
MSNGKWGDDVTPKRGWTCAAVFDNETPTVECEMCEHEMCRYVHIMHHSNHPVDIRAGCICAGYMEGWFEKDNNPARERERPLRNRAQRRQKWLSRVWTITKKGNPKVQVDGKIVVVFHTTVNQWKFMITGEISQLWFSTEDAAKLGAFDQLYPSSIVA